MSYYYSIRAKLQPTEKSNQRKPDVFKGTPTFVNLEEFRSDRQLWKHTEKELRRYIKKRLKQIPEHELSFPQKIVGDKTTVRLLKNYDSSQPLFDEEIELPERIKDIAEKQNTEQKTSRKVKQ